MKLHYLLFFCLFIRPMLPMESEKPTENSASLELRIDALSAKIELLQSEIAQLDKKNDSELIAEKEKTIHLWLSQKKRFEELKRRFQELSEKTWAATAVQDHYCEDDFDDPKMKKEVASLSDKSTSELLDLIRQVDDQKSAAFLELSDLFYDSGTTKQDIGVVVQDLNFLHQNNLLIHAIPCLKKFSLDHVTFRQADSDSEIIQFEVMNQFLAGGAASCSYHAIKNGIVLMLAMHAELRFQNFVIKNLQRESLINALFGYFESPWRSRVIVFRKKYLIKEYIKNLLLYCLEGAKEFKKTEQVNSHLVPAPQRPKGFECCHPFRFADYANWMVFKPFKDPRYHESIRLAYMYLLNEVAQNILEKIQVEAVQTAPIVITPHNILESFTSAINKQIARGTLNYRQDSSVANEFGHEPYVVAYTDLLDHDLIHSYFPLLKKLTFIINETIRDTITGKSFNEASFNYYVGCGKIQYNKVYDGFAGELAEADELKLIIEYEKRNGLLKIIDDLHANYITFFAGDSALTRDGNPTFKGNFIFEVDGQIFYDETFAKIKKFLAQENSYFTALVIFHIHEHWVTLVINKAGKSKQYVVTDSINTPRQTESQLRINDRFIHEFIRLVEGVEEPEMAGSVDFSSSSDQTKSAASSSICTIS